MKRKLPWSGLGACIGMLLLILDGKTALLGAREGVVLCIRTVIPALFPFLFLSSMLMGMSFPFLRPLGRLFRVPKGAEQLLIPAFLGGYPVGAQSVAAAYHEGTLEKREAERMLAFCSNAGPSFLFGMIAPLFPAVWMVWALWGIHVGSAILAAQLIQSGGRRSTALHQQKAQSSSAALGSAVHVMALICGWVVLFRVVIVFLKRWLFFLLNMETQVVVTGLLELTNGCCALPLVENIGMRFTICSCLLAAGGLCVTMQTLSVTRGLSLRYYAAGKVLQTMFSLLFCGCLFRGRSFIFLMPLLYFGLKMMKKQKKTGKVLPAGI